VADMTGAKILRHGREAKAGVNLALSEQLGRCRRLTGDPADVVGRVEPDMSSRNRHEQVVARSESRDADRLAFEVGDAADAVLPKQFETADMHA